jgi:hypothetical protein
MKRHLTLILLVFIAAIAFGQTNYQDVVYLKNGSIIRGIVIEQVPNKSIKIETSDRSVFVYQMDEIEKLTKEQVAGKNSDDKGNIDQKYRFAIGIYGSPILPLGSFGDVYKMGSGFGAKIFFSKEKSSNKGSSFGINVGYLNFQSKDYSSMSCNIIPVVIFTEDYSGKGKIKSAWGFEIGGYNFKTKGYMFGYDISDSRMKFGAGTYIGILAELNKQISIASNVKYNYILDFKNFADAPSWVGIDLGLVYKFGSPKKD